MTDPPKITIEPDPPTQGQDVDVGRTNVTTTITLKVTWTEPDVEPSPIEVTIDASNPSKKIETPRDAVTMKVEDCSSGAATVETVVTPA